MVCINGLPWALPKAEGECCAFGAKQILAWKPMPLGLQTGNSEIHLNNAGWDRDEVPNDGQALPFLPVKLTTSR